MIQEAGQCLCGELTYAVSEKPQKLILCHCSFCQRATGAAYMIDALFHADDFRLTSGQPAQYSHVSDTSGKEITIHFCRRCGTKTHLLLEILPGFVGVYAGTFERPDWFGRSPEAETHIFTASASQGTVLPAGSKIFEHGLVDSSGARESPELLIEHRVVKP